MPKRNEQSRDENGQPHSACRFFGSGFSVLDGVQIPMSCAMRSTWLLLFQLLSVHAVDVAVHSSGAVESNHVVRRERRKFECSTRQVVTECPASTDGKSACESAKVLKGSATHSPCVWIAADPSKNTPNVCALDTHDPCYEDNFYDRGRGPKD
eukprot:Skav206895  [mRNA]  locus=scaffold2387:250714:259281:+ [translate_table: standard]